MTPIRSLTLSPLLLTLTAAAGVGICKAAGLNPHLKEMWIACGVGLAAAELGMVPALIRRRSPDAAALFLAALGGSVLHMGVMLVLAIVLTLLLKLPTAFIFWIMAVYWPTLIGLCLVFRQMFQASTPAKTEK